MIVLMDLDTIRAAPTRQWLVGLLRLHQVIVLSDRPEREQEQTMRMVWRQVGWQPSSSLFNAWDASKESYLRMAVRYLIDHHQLQRHLDFGLVMAIESDPAVRQVYARFGIPCLHVSSDSNK